MKKTPIKLKHSIGFKIGLFLVTIFVITGSVSTLLFTDRVRKTEFSLFQEENKRIVRVLAKELFSDATVLEEHQIIEGPYGFETGEIKKIQEKFAQLFQDMTGKNMVLLNIYNSDGRVVASNFPEFEGHTAEGLGEAHDVNDILAGGKGLAKLVKSENIHPQLFWKGKEINKDVFEIYVPIEIDGENVGVVETYFIPETELKEHILQMIVVTGISILITVIFIYLFFIIYIIRPLRAIGEAMHPIGKGEFMNFIKFKHDNRDEIGKLANDFNKMLRGLNSLSDEIARLKEVGKMKSEFISIVAHQLRTPLTGIKWVVESILEKKDLSGEVHQSFNKIQNLNEKMLNITNDFLNTAQIEKGKMYSRLRENVDLVALIGGVIKTHQTNAERKHIALSFPQHGLAPVYIKADQNKLIGAFDNLLDNAINYTADNGSIDIELIKKGESIIVKISDNGIGVSKEDLPKLFGRFYRSKEARLIEPSGSGVGLFIAKNIIEGHNGNIRVESNDGKSLPAGRQGTSFYIEFITKKYE